MATLGIGTVQFGMPYGITNLFGQPSLEEVTAILKTAAENQVSVLDTAALYGTSEEVLGKALSLNKEWKFKIVTKTAKVKDLKDPVAALKNTFEQSLKKLKRNSVYGLLFHDPADLLSPRGEDFFETALTIKKQGHVQKLGVSVYTQEELEFILKRYPIELVQLPTSILDQRLVKNGWLKKLKQKNIEVHVRSAFLKGLVFMNQNSLSSYFQPVKNQLLTLNETAKTHKTSVLEMSLAYLFQIPEIDVVLCGIHENNQLREITTALESLKKKDWKKVLTPELLERIEIKDPAVVNPGLWPKTI